jgi:YgiT-type zinc finger domain-containing protein
MKKAANAARCPTCGLRGMVRVSRSVLSRVGSATVVVRGVVVDLCPHCGERLYDLAALRRIRAGRRPHAA